MASRRVLHVIDRLGVGGAEFMLVTAAEQAASIGWDLEVISLGDAPQSPVPARLRALGVPTRAVPSNARRTLLDVGRANRLRGLLKSLDPDVIHTHLSYSNTLVPVVLGRQHPPLVATLHNVGAGVRRGQVGRDRLEREVLRRGYDLRIGVGPAVAQAQRSRLGCDVVVLPNPVAQPASVTAEMVRAARAELLAGSDGPLLLAAGRLTEQKGYSDLLAAFRAIRNQEPEAVLAVAGRGHLGPELEELAQSLGISASTRFLGPRSDLPVLMRAADLFVMSSLWEGLPLVLLEAMLAGVPVVATDVGDVAYALDGAGVLVPAAQPQALAQATLGLLGDPQRGQELAARARTIVEARNLAPRWAARLEALYAGLPGGSHV